MITFKTLSRCNFFMQNNSKLHVINVIDETKFFDKICENAKENLRNIIVRIFIFFIKNNDHDFILEISYEQRTILLFKYFIDKSCEITIHSQCDTQRVKFQTIALNHKSNKTVDFIFSQKSLN